MSMSQEEIEALMNGLDISENEKSSEDEKSTENEPSQDVSNNQIDDLISENSASGTVSEDVSIDNSPDESNIDELLASIEQDNSSEEDASFDSNSIDELINGMNEDNSDNIEDSELSSEDETSSTSNKEGIVENDDSISMDEIDSIIDGITSEDDKELKSNDQVDVDTSEIDDLIAGLEDNNSSTTTTNDTDDDFLSGIDFNNDAQSIEDMDTMQVPEPEIDDTSISSSNKRTVLDIENINIPNQLAQVADDSEEKATKIFDALSYILDDNQELRKTVKTLDDFIKSQHKMLEVLHNKFPNVKEFSENLDTVNSLIDKPSEIQSRLNNRDTELFETMELMQFHDINRQKIERVMGVVINLSKQLNSIFEEDDSTKNVPISKHLPGDKNTSLVDGDDLESLIQEYSK